MLGADPFDLRPDVREPGFSGRRPMQSVSASARLVSSGVIIVMAPVRHIAFDSGFEVVVEATFLYGMERPGMRAFRGERSSSRGASSRTR
ncbi:hypothetical protein GR157_02065 [Burkholderia sp. 4701]|nr:hypothetical protein [Burkholderia sp. 4701]MXN81152.1 hypothetical protein [Burkholderia sp. 4812]